MLSWTRSRHGRRGRWMRFTQSVYLDCIHAKVRDSGVVRLKTVYLALGVNLNGDKELLGLWVAQTAGAKF
jgi:transposase-like protein